MSVLHANFARCGALEDCRTCGRVWSLRPGMGWEIRTFSAWPLSVQEIEDSLTKAARDCRCATRGSQNRHQTKRSTVGPRRRKLSDQLSEKAERSAVGLHLSSVPARCHSATALMNPPTLQSSSFGSAKTSPCLF